MIRMSEKYNERIGLKEVMGEIRRVSGYSHTL